MIPADYEPVEDRLRAFWEDFPTGRVITQIVALPAHAAVAIGAGEYVRGETLADTVIFACALFRFPEDKEPAATGYAHQRILSEPPKSSSGKSIPTAPEWTSPYEVAETSAIGRALANLGYAAKGKRPSREEVSKARASEGPSRQRSRNGEGESGSKGPSESTSPKAAGGESDEGGPTAHDVAGSVEEQPALSDNVTTTGRRQCDHDWQGLLIGPFAGKGWKVCTKCGRTQSPTEEIRAWASRHSLTNPTEATR